MCIYMCIYIYIYTCIYIYIYICLFTYGFDYNFTNYAFRKTLGLLKRNILPEWFCLKLNGCYVITARAAPHGQGLLVVVLLLINLYTNTNSMIYYTILYYTPLILITILYYRHY